MKKLLLPLLFITLFCLILLPLSDAKARQGCCSHHGGVCGCHCCDGTPLSAKCAPYYPQCSSKTIPEYESPKTPEYKPSVPEVELLATEKFTAEIPKENNGSRTIWWWIIGIGVSAYLFYRFKKRTK